MSIVSTMPSKRPAYLVRLDPEVKDAVAAAAARDGRSASNFLERMILDWLRANDFLGKPERNKRGKDKPSK
jgi:hypothetical protein